MNLKIFVEGTIYEPISTLMFIAYFRHQDTGKFLFALSLFLLLIWKTAVDKNFQSFCVKTIYEPIIMLMLVA